MDQFMDQVKTIVRVLVAYRFWIAISIAALFSGVAYFLGSRPIQDKTKSETAAIEKAEKDVQQFSSPGLPNDQYEPLVKEKTAVLTQDVNAAWRTLYNRQVPLLTWPDTVQDRFPKWGRGWPENVDPSKVEAATLDYAEAYPRYVESLYKICKPFNFETGEEGVVMAPPMETLLRPATFDINKPVPLGTVWSTQERHWTQRTLLEVVAAVNKKAKNWDEAIIKQVDGMEVGSPLAQDQRSIAAGDELEEAEPILAPGEEAEEEPVAPMGGGRGGRDDDDQIGVPGMGGNASSTAVFFINKGQYKIMPVYLAVLIDQDKIQNLLVELENSPMSVQVMDYEMARPVARVIRPDLSAGIYNNFNSYDPMMGPGSFRSRRGERGMPMRGMNGFSNSFGLGSRMGGMRGFGPPTSTPKGTDLRGTNRKERREEEEKAMENAKSGPSLFDPYYNIVEVRIYGQARFYNPPPPVEETESLGNTAEEGAEAAAVAAPKAEAPEEAEPKDDAAKVAKPKAEAPKNAEEPKAKAAAPKGAEPPM